jgi:hypothetical protein
MMKISAGSINILSCLAAICYTVVTISTTTTTTSVSAFTTPSQQRSIINTQIPRSLSVLNEKEEKKGKFSLGNLFNGGGGNDESGTTTALRGGKLEPHPSVRSHISALNRLGPDPQLAPTSEPLPVHPDVRSGTLPNGLPYVILPNKSPPGRFEAHLQVFSGSADELEPQQGIAHLTEHVAYMGSRKRELLFGTGSQTNGTSSKNIICTYLSILICFNILSILAIYSESYCYLVRELYTAVACLYFLTSLYSSLSPT